jgi:hypothetical protein
MNATPKMGVHLGVIRLNLLHSPLLVKMHFTLEHIIFASCAFALHT